MGGSGGPSHLHLGVWGSETLDTLHGPRSHSSDCRAISETGVHTCRPPNHSCQGLVLRCGAKDGRGVRLGPQLWGERTVPGCSQFSVLQPSPWQAPGSHPHRGPSEIRAQAWGWLTVSARTPQRV